VLRGRIASARGDLAEASHTLSEAVARWPGDLEARNAQCQFLFEHATPVDAERALLEMLQQDPRNPSTQHNLGLCYLRSRRYREAVRAFEESLRYRPDAAATYLHLGYALKAGGRIKDAVAAWEHVLRLAPGDPTARAELDRVGGQRLLV
jgi:tetratricopeptide (TPR) repeat protein